MKLSDDELVDLAMNNAYAMLVGNKSIDDLLDEEEEMVLVPDPEISDEELSEDLIEYFITTEEYEKCAKIKDLMNFRKMIDNILNDKEVIIKESENWTELQESLFRKMLQQGGNFSIGNHKYRIIPPIK